MSPRDAIGSLRDRLCSEIIKRELGLAAHEHKSGGRICQQVPGEQVRASSR